MKGEIDMIRTLRSAATVLSLAALTVFGAGCAADPSSEEASSDENTDSSASAFAVTSTNYDLPLRGGTGGNASTMKCLDSRDVVVGLQVRYGNVIDQMTLICARLAADGSVGPHYTTATRGGTGGTATWTFECIADDFVAGLVGYAATYIDRIGVVCRNAAGTRESLIWAQNGARQNTWFRDECPGARAITSIAVKTGNVIDSVKGRCSYIGEE